MSAKNRIFKTLRHLTLILVMFLFTFLFTQNLVAQPADYKYRKRVLLASSEVYGSSNHVNFPLMVSLTDSDLKSELNGGGVFSNSGYDILLTTLAGSPLDQQLQTYNPATGNVIL